MYTLCKSYPINFYVADEFLHMTEQYSGSREGSCYRLQLAQYLVTLIYADPLLSAMYGGDNLPEAVFLLWGEVKRHIDGVYHPPQENLSGGPCTVSCI